MLTWIERWGAQLLMLVIGILTTVTTALGAKPSGWQFVSVIWVAGFWCLKAGGWR